MRSRVAFLKMAFMIGGGALIAQEVVVTTTKGEAFVMEISVDDRFSDVIKVAEAFLDPSSRPNKLLVEMDLDASIVEKLKCNAKKHGQYRGAPRDYYAPMSHQELGDIRFIVTFLANRSLISIAAHRGDLEEAGDRIDHLHPLRFLMHVFTDEELKVGIRNIRGKGWVWGDFVGGLKESLATETNNSNMLEDYIYDFARVVKIDYALVSSLILSRKWDEFIDTLIATIPRQGDHGRFDS